VRRVTRAVAATSSAPRVDALEHHLTAVWGPDPMAIGTAIGQSRTRSSGLQPRRGTSAPREDIPEAPGDTRRPVRTRERFHHGNQPVLPSVGLRPMSASNEQLARSNAGRLGRLAHFITRHRWRVIGVWVVSVASRPDSCPRAGIRASRSPASRPTREVSGRSRPWGSGRVHRTSSSFTPAATRRRTRRSSARCSEPRQLCPAPARARISRLAT
jgi:hypothetical protein